jgi:glycosyltransferase involved in cell wall biosynthesis
MTTHPPPRTVLQLTWSLVAGGAETYALTIADNLDRAKYRPAFCAVDQGGALEAEVRRRGYPCAILWRRPGVELALMWRLYRLFRQWKVRVVHTHHFNQLFYGVLGARLAGARVIHTEHSVECYKRPRLRVALRLLSLLCHTVTVIGRDGERTLRARVGIPARKLRLIRAGVGLPEQSESRADARAAMGLSDSDRVVAIVARLSPEKNHRLLLSAFATVARELPAARLLIAGDGPERDAVAREVARLSLTDRVQLLGVRRDVARILTASDLFVLCSDREGLPIAVLEAMAAGRPVVATAVGDLPSVVRDGEGGLIVPPGDPGALANAMSAILSEPARAAAMGARGRQLVERTYGVGPMLDKLQNLYGPP